MVEVVEAAAVPAALISIPAAGIRHCQLADCTVAGDRRASGEMMAEGEGKVPGGGKGLGVRTFFRGVSAPGLSPNLTSLVKQHLRH